MAEKLRDVSVEAQRVGPDKLAVAMHPPGVVKKAVRTGLACASAEDDDLHASTRAARLRRSRLRRLSSCRRTGSRPGNPFEPGVRAGW